MKFFDLLTTANHNLFRNKTRTFLTILAVFIGSFTIILSNAINSGVNDFIDKQVESIGGDGYIEIAPDAMYEQMSSTMGGSSEVVEYNPDKGTAMTASIPKEDLEKIRKIDGVEKANPYHTVSAEYITSSDTTKKYTITLNLLPDNSLSIDTVAGKQVDADSGEPQIMIPESYVKALGFSSNEAAIGQKVSVAVKQEAKCYMVSNPEECLAAAEATVVGIQAPDILSMGNSARANLAFIDQLYELSTAGAPDSVKDKTYFVIGSADPSKIDQVKSALKDLGYTAVTVDDEAGMIRTFFDVILVVFNIFGGIALLAAAIGIINTLFMSVQERTREIGLMKALGMGNGKIFLAFSLEAILLGFWGSVVGIAFSMLLGFAGNTLAHETFLADFPTFQLVVFNPVNMLIIVGIIMLIAFIAGTAPARRASRENPIDALRYE